MTSWEEVGKWYDSLVGVEGHYYHKQVIFPKLLPLLGLTKSSSLLDLGCGQGVLSRILPEEIAYHGIDISPTLIKAAKRTKNRQFSVGDMCKPIKSKGFSHVTMLLCLQNVAEPARAILNAAQALESGGTFVMVLNHPCFRIPRQTHWGVDTQKKLQYRRIDSYFSEQKIPIQMHPGKKNSATTWSFHHPLSHYSRWLNEAGFCIELIDEWCSDKKSTGKAAKMENRSRSEFPLFLTIKSRKK